MQTKQTYYQDQYKRNISTKIISVETNVSMTSVILEETIFYPEGGGQPSDQGVINGKNGKLEVQQVLIRDGEIIHIGQLSGQLTKGETVECVIDWNRRIKNMRVHSAGHIINDATLSLFPDLIPIGGEHGAKPFIKYEGRLDQISSPLIKEKANGIISEDLPIKTEFVTLDELKKRATWLPPNLPKGKPLRIMQIGGYSVIPDGGTQVKRTGEVIGISEVNILKENKFVYVNYKVVTIQPTLQGNIGMNVSQNSLSFDSDEAINIKNQSISQITLAKDKSELEQIRIDLFGKNGKITELVKRIKSVPTEKRQQIGILINDTKKTLENLISEQSNSFNESAREWFDPTVPGIKPRIGHLHIVTQAITEISKVFESIGFERERYPEVEWDFYAFEGLNMPKGHPARDEWETFFIDVPENKKFGRTVLTPHTSNGQVREMLAKKNPPIRMINISKTYRRQSDVSHVPMFHQFEGLVVDQSISIVNLKGTLDYFAKSFFGVNRKTRLRPYHFQFTEPSFEIDISCGNCNGTGKISSVENCKLCKAGWLELGGAGMVHPNVLKTGGVDPDKYSGFAFGWGVERTFMMKSGLNIPDIRLLYSADLRFLQQF